MKIIKITLLLLSTLSTHGLSAAGQSAAAACPSASASKPSAADTKTAAASAATSLTSPKDRAVWRGMDDRHSADSRWIAKNDTIAILKQWASEKHSINGPIPRTPPKDGTGPGIVKVILAFNEENKMIAAKPLDEYHSIDSIPLTQGVHANRASEICLFVDYPSAPAAGATASATTVN